MQESVPQTGKEAAVFDQVVEMDCHTDNGLRVYQDALHYSIYHMFVNGGKNTSRKKAVSAAHYLRDLSERLQKLEDLLKETT